MQDKQIPLKNTGYISKLICDYTEQDPKLAHLYDEFPDINGFKKQIQKKRNEFSAQTRTVLVDSLQSQYETTKASVLTEAFVVSY